jgi:hypothetical protein
MPIWHSIIVSPALRSTQGQWRLLAYFAGEEAGRNQMTVVVNCRAVDCAFLSVLPPWLRAAAAYQLQGGELLYDVGMCLLKHWQSRSFL